SKTITASETYLSQPLNRTFSAKRDANWPSGRAISDAAFRPVRPCHHAPDRLDLAQVDADELSVHGVQCAPSVVGRKGVGEGRRAVAGVRCRGAGPRAAPGVESACVPAGRLGLVLLALALVGARAAVAAGALVAVRRRTVALLRLVRLVTVGRGRGG